MLPKEINRQIGKALHDYQMLADGDRVLVGVSGGVDSLALVWTLKHWQRKAPIKYEILAVHIDKGFDQTGYKDVESELTKVDVPTLTEHTTFGKDAYELTPESVCYHCAKQRRKRLFSIAKEKGYNKIALGHHKDDIIETFFLNMLYSGNISTMLPKQELFDGRLNIIRPFSYLLKKQVISIAAQANLMPVKNPCPMADKTKRDEIRGILDSLYNKNELFRSNIFASLSNVRNDYMLKSSSTQR